MISPDPDARCQRLGPEDRVMVDILRVAQGDRRSIGYQLIDMTRALSLVASLADRHQRRFTLTTVFTRAAARALEEHPALNWFRRGYRIIKPGRIDIGLSVATSARLSPVIIIEDAARKSFLTVQQEIERRSRQAREKEAETIALYRKTAYLVPFGFLRRWLLGYLWRNAGFLRQNTGTMQISNLNRMGVDMAATAAVGKHLLMLGDMRNRPMVVDGRVEPRPSVYVAAHIDHTIVSGVEAAGFLSAFSHHMENPECLLVDEDREQIP